MDWINEDNSKIHTKLYLINIVTQQLKKQPLFITDDATFGVNYFNQWKKQNSKENLLCQIQPIDFILSKNFTKTDIQTSRLGDINVNQETSNNPRNDPK